MRSGVITLISFSRFATHPHIQSKESLNLQLTAGEMAAFCFINRVVIVNRNGVLWSSKG